MSNKVTLAHKIAAAILIDVKDRRGWRQEWDGFDDDIKVEIFDKWVERIEAKLAGEPLSSHEALNIEIIEEHREYLRGETE